MLPLSPKVLFCGLIIATVLSGIGIFSNFWALCYYGNIGLWKLCAYTGCYWFWDRFEEFNRNVDYLPTWFISVQTLIGIGFALNVLGFVLGIVYLCTYFTKMGKTLGKIAALLLFLAACFELLGICVFIAKVRLDRNAFFQVDPAFVIHSGVGWAFYVSLAGAILLLIISLLMLWESSTGY